MPVFAPRPRPGAGFLLIRRKKMTQSLVLDREEVVGDGLETADYDALFAPPESVVLGPAPLERAPVAASTPAKRREEQELWLPFPLFFLWLSLAFLAVVPMLALLGAAIWLSVGG
jgi:hypothetical protein